MIKFEESEFQNSMGNYDQSGRHPVCGWWGLIKGCVRLVLIQSILKYGGKIRKAEVMLDGSWCHGHLLYLDERVYYMQVK